MNKILNNTVNSARQTRRDEFYTEYSDVEKELSHYSKHFKDKTVFCNCDDPSWSAFWQYFFNNFHTLKLKSLISTHYEKNSSSYMQFYDGNKEHKYDLKENGDFRSEECIELLKQSDIVVTNPPFSLFKEYTALLEKYKKKFIIWGNINAVTYKDFFKSLKDNNAWIGYFCNSTCVFRLSDAR